MDIFHYLSWVDTYAKTTLSTVQDTFGIALHDLLVDHRCLRVDSNLLYQHIKNQLHAAWSIFLSEKVVGGRNISVFDCPWLQSSITNYDTLIELPAPKATHHYLNGRQHIEVVVPDVDTLLIQYPNLARDLSWYEKQYNRDISLFIDTNHEIKFHEQPLREVLAIEEN
jgi:predicted metalloenzyme YecM